jgi:hypothetical protein
MEFTRDSLRQIQNKKRSGKKELQKALRERELDKRNKSTIADSLECERGATEHLVPLNECASATEEGDAIVAESTGTKIVLELGTLSREKEASIHIANVVVEGYCDEYKENSSPSSRALAHQRKSSNDGGDESDDSYNNSGPSGEDPVHTMGSGGEEEDQKGVVEEDDNTISRKSSSQESPHVAKKRFIQDDNNSEDEEDVEELRPRPGEEESSTDDAHKSGFLSHFEGRNQRLSIASKYCSLHHRT